ncbi:hypothetical protein [Kordia sp.]|uniref:hypothetical protein n=1 Tax=Kordia sp. TaxID=1965332 RepID=UPI003B5C3003
MAFFINLDPNTEEIEATYNKYLNREQEYPEAPVEKRKPLLIFFYLLSALISGIPAIILQILRIPFLIIRKIRIGILKKESKCIFDENYGSDPDNWREHVFEDPGYKPSKSDKKIQAQKDEYLEKATSLREEWYEEPENLNKLVHYATYNRVVEGHKGNKKCLFILDQLKELPEKSNLNYDVLYWNLHVLNSSLNMKNQAAYYKNIASKNGYIPEDEQMSNFKKYILALAFFTNHSWKKLYRQIVNCWPSLN